MEPQEQKLNVVLKFANTQIFLVENEKVHSLVTGTMNLIEFPAYDSYIISVGDFGYTLSRDIPVLAKKMANGETIYILPNVQGYYGLKLPADANPQLIDVFEVILQNMGEFLTEVEEPPVKEPPVQENEKKLGGFILKKSADYDPKKAVEQSKPTVVQGEEEVRNKVSKEKVKSKEAGSNDQEGLVKPDPSEDVPTSTKVSNVVVKSGEVIRDGLIKVAGYTAEGISKAGTYLVHKFMKKSEDVEVNQATQKKIKLAKTATNAFVVFTTVQIKAIIAAAGMIAKEIGEQWEDSKDGKAMKEKPAYQTAKKIGKSAVQATATVYDGMYQALVLIGKGVGKTTTEAVSYRYGQQAGTATEGVMDAVGNVGLVYKALPMEAAKAFATKEAGTDSNKVNVKK